MRLAAALALACLAGCATYTPEQLRAEGQRAEVQSRSAPFTAISCAARRAEEFHSDFSAATRQGQASNSAEATVRIGHKILAVIEAAPNGSGSKLAIWTPPNWSDEVAMRFVQSMNGC